MRNAMQCDVKWRRRRKTPDHRHRRTNGMSLPVSAGRSVGSQSHDTTRRGFIFQDNKKGEEKNAQAVDVASLSLCRVSSQGKKRKRHSTAAGAQLYKKGRYSTSRLRRLWLHNTKKKNEFKRQRGKARHWHPFLFIIKCPAAHPVITRRVVSSHRLLLLLVRDITWRRWPFHLFPYSPPPPPSPDIPTWGWTASSQLF